MTMDIYTLGAVGLVSLALYESVAIYSRHLKTTYKNESKHLGEINNLLIQNHSLTDVNRSLKEGCKTLEKELSTAKRHIKILSMSKEAIEEYKNSVNDDYYESEDEANERSEQTSQVEKDDESKK
jgi:predicted transcriptional regulator